MNFMRLLSGGRVFHSSRKGGFPYGNHAVSLCLLIFIAMTVIPCSLLAQESGKKEASPDRVVFVPFDKMKGPQWSEENSVLIPYAEFLKLKGTGDPEKPESKPVAAIAKSIFKGKIDSDMAVLDAEIVIDVIAEDGKRMTIPMNFENAAVSSVEIEGAAAALAPMDRKAGFNLILEGGGSRNLKLKILVPLKSSGAEKILDFKTPRAAASSLELSIPREVKITSRKNQTPATVEKVDNGSTLIRATSGTGYKYYIVYEAVVTRTGAAAKTRFVVEQGMTLEISSNLVNVSSQISVQPLTGGRL